VTSRRWRRGQFKRRSINLLHQPNVNAIARRSKPIRCGLSQHRAQVRAAVQIDVADAVCGGAPRSVASRGNAVPARR